MNEQFPKMKITPELLQRYQAKQCTPDEVKAVEQWLDTADDEPSFLTGQQLQSMEQGIWENLEPSYHKGAASQAIPLYRQVMRYAAAVVILFSIGFLTYHYFVKPGQPDSDLAYLEAYTSVQTQRGQKRTVKLSDGSTIRMNYETEIRVPEKFEGKERIVYLTGHAHFNVARDTERPFVIYTDDSKTQVLGTSFDINTKEEETEIIVTSGKVAFSEKDKQENQVTLTLNDRAVLSTGKEIKTDKVDALTLTAWKDNRLVLKDKTLKEIVSVLEPWFDVQVTVENQQLLDDRFNLSLNNPPLTEALERLTFMGSFDYEIDGKKVIIR
ncbi:MAG: FecR domain-containing protein [Bacteroidota bacterium]